MVMYADFVDTRTGGSSAPVAAGWCRAGAGSQDGRNRPQGLIAPRTPAEDGTWPLAHRPEASGTARRITRSVLECWRAGDEEAEAVLLVVSELVTNAVEHAQPPVSLHLHRERVGRRVWVGITDSGPASREGEWTAACSDGEHGRGMSIIDALAVAHGIRTHAGGGATHWARLPLAA
jgi:anti-sigma regulatory factor (Ser/Thr protein kinase)